MANKVRRNLVVSVVVVTAVAALLSLSGCPPQQGDSTSVPLPESAEVVDNAAPPDTQTAPARTEPPPSVESVEPPPEPDPTEPPPPEPDATEPPAPGPVDSSQPNEAEGRIIEVTRSTFEKEVLGTDKPVVIDFWATWCVPCYIVRPLLEELAAQYAGQVKFVAVECGANKGLADQFGIRYIPTMVVVQGGKEKDRFGFQSDEQLREKIAEVAASAG